MLEGSAVRVHFATAGMERPGNVFIGRVGSMDFSGVQLLGRWHRKTLKDDGHKEAPVGSVDLHTFFPWSSLDYVEILPESENRETQFAEVYQLGMQALKSKNYEAAIRYFNEAIGLKPGDQKSQYYLEEAQRLARG